MILIFLQEQNRNLEKKIKKLTTRYHNDIRRLTQELQVAKKTKADLEKWINNLSQQLDLSKVTIAKENSELKEQILRQDLEIKVILADQRTTSER